MTFEEYWMDCNHDPNHYAEISVAFKAGAAAEREAILELRNHEDVMAPVGQSTWGEAYQDGWIAGVQEYVDQIRARNQ